MSGNIGRLLEGLGITDAPAAVGTPSQSYSSNKSANTRFLNDQKRAASQSMGGNIAARSVLKPRVNGANSGGKPPVGRSQPQLPMIQAGQPGMGVPQQGNSLPIQPNSDPVGELKQKVDLEMVMRTPKFQSAVTKNRLKEYFQRRNNPNYIDPTPGERVQDMFNLTD
jgi:hypothetical protein